jgi:ribosome biogenesis GTPase A
LLLSTQVLDARDPLGTRCRFLEQHVRKHLRHKHMLLLLNKCDLVSLVRGRLGWTACAFVGLA